MTHNVLNAGFTGDVAQDPKAFAKARDAYDYVRDEAGMVAAHAADHPAATGSALLTVGLLGLAVGYMLGATSRPRQSGWGF
ncbi:hypothetical protein ACQKKX_14380 [Neorhizobium sp. NPDC001467]|uniref:hypothetical protein n=1 Tax=Neorhizobium sp. NPDC001467 TaxID=3390595 RepID=UPI003D051E7A